MKHKKMFLFTIIICILMSFTPFTTIVTADMPDIQLLDFNDNQTYTKYVKVGSILNDFIKNTSTYESPAAMSGQWNQTTALAGSLNDFCLYSTAQNWSVYGYLNLRIYAPAADGATYQLTLFSGASTYSGVGYNRVNMKIEKQGWHTVSIPLSDFGARASEVRGIGFTFGGWGSTAAASSYICMSNVWVSEKIGGGSGTSPEVSYDDELDILVLADFDTKTSITSTVPEWTVDESVKRMYEQSAKWTDAVNKSTVNIDLPSGKRNVAGFEYLNQWVYSEKATNSAVNTIFVQNGVWAYFRTTFTVDWVGWKLLTFRITDNPTTQAPDLTSMGYISYNAGGWGTDADPEMELNFEKIWLSKTLPEKLSVTGSFPANNSNNISSGKMTTAVEYTNYISQKNSKNSIEVMCDGQQINDFEILPNRYQLQISFDTEPNKNYSVSTTEIYDSYGQKATPYTFSFNTAANGLTISEPIIKSGSNTIWKLPDNGTTGAFVDVKNNSGAEKYLKLVFAIYDQNGVMCDFQVDDVNLADGDSRTLEAYITGTSYENCSVAAMLCDGDTLEPIGNTALTMTKSGFSKGLVTASQSASRGITLEAAVLSSDNKLSMSGRLMGDMTALTLLKVKKDNTVNMLIPLVPNKNGILSYNYIFGTNSEESGRYSVSLLSRGTSESNVINVYFADDILRESIKNSVNNAAAVTDVKTALTDNADAFFGASVTASEIEFIANTLFEQRPFTDYEKIIEIKDRAFLVLSAIISSHWSNLSGIIETNNDILFPDKELYNTFKALNPEASKDVLVALLGTGAITDFVQFRVLLSDCIKNVPNNNNNNNNSNNNGGGNTGGGGYSGGGFSSSHTVSKPETPPEISDTNEPFTDISVLPWAESDILSLYSLGIISPSEDKLYRPDDAVLREEWIKLMIEAFKLTDPNAYCDFADTEKSAWYYIYIASAVSKGIAGGYGDGYFGIGDRITRQDMTVLLYRTAKILEIQLVELHEAEEFKDSDEINDYAKEAVTAMQRAGLLSGIGDGYLNPNGIATRAQAAVLLNRMLNRN